MTTNDDRYAGRPLVVLLENLVLRQTGNLEHEKDELAARVVRRTYGGGNNWVATLLEVLQESPSVLDDIDRQWAESSRRSDPLSFARDYVDSRFPSISSYIPADNG
jgi:hypothetical protein